MKKRNYHRGDVFLADLGIRSGSEQCGKRPVVIMQNDNDCIHSPTVTMVPMTTVHKKLCLKSHYRLRHTDWIRYPSIVEAEQIQTIDKRRIIRKLGYLSQDDIGGIEEALRNHLGFDIPEELEPP